MVSNVPQRVAALAGEIHAIARERTGSVQTISRNMKLLSINASIEAAHAGDKGLGFGVVAEEINRISKGIDGEVEQLGQQLGDRSQRLVELGGSLVAQVFGTRLVDLAHNLIEIMDRNLYERTCDVRWWATEAAVIRACTSPGLASAEACASRLAVILRSYTVYADILVLDRRGVVLASGRNRACIGANLSSRKWFAAALATTNGDEFSVDDIAREAVVSNNMVATYATAVRCDGASDGQVIGVIAVLFDWQVQAQTVVDGVRLDAAERARARCLILDRQHQVLAASDRKGMLSEQIPLPGAAERTGWIAQDGRILAWAQTPGFETYRGLGWYGAIELRP